MKELMAGVADFKEGYQPQSWERLKASIGTRISVWMGVAGFVGLMISRIFPKKQRTYVPGRIPKNPILTGEFSLANAINAFELASDRGKAMKVSLVASA
jgi:hypothetical protein